MRLKILKNIKQYNPLALNITAIGSAITLFLQIVMTPAFAQSFLDVIPPGTLLKPSRPHTPVIIMGMTIHPANPLRFDFIIDAGDSGLDGEDLQNECRKLINYFLATLTVPNDELWVNLSPYEENRIIADSLSQTEMGRDMLNQDYILKQFTASLMYPEEKLGHNFWNRIKEKSKSTFGHVDIPTNTFSKVWIVPDQPAVFISDNNIFINQNHLKVMLEEDYLAMDFHHKSPKSKTGLSPKETVPGKLSSQVIQEIIMPEIEKEVNEGEHFANLRQIYNSMLLATWYKQNLKKSIIGNVYMNKNKVDEIAIEDKQVKEKIYNQYVEAFQTGVYNYVKEEYDPIAKNIIYTKYFSGGLLPYQAKTIDSAMLTSVFKKPILVAVDLVIKVKNRFSRIDLVDRLERKLKETDSDQIKQETIEALGKMKERSAKTIPTILNILKKTDNSAVHIYGGIALGRIIKKSHENIPLLIKEFQNAETPRLQITFADAIGIIRKPARDAVTDLERVLKDTASDEVKTKILFALGSMEEHAERAIPTMIYAIESSKANYFEEIGLQIWGGSALGYIIKAAPQNIPFLIKKFHEAKTPRMQTTLADAIATVGIEAADAVTDLAHRLRKTKSSEVKQHILKALGAIGGPSAQAVPTIIKVIKDSNNPLIHLYGYLALSNTGRISSESLPELLSLSDHPSSEGNLKKLVAAIGHVDREGRATAVSSLKTLFESHDNEELKFAIAEAFGNLGETPVALFLELKSLYRKLEIWDKEKIIHAIGLLNGRPQDALEFLLTLESSFSKSLSSNHIKKAVLQLSSRFMQESLDYIIAKSQKIKAGKEKIFHETLAEIASLDFEKSVSILRKKIKMIADQRGEKTNIEIITRLQGKRTNMEIITRLLESLESAAIDAVPELLEFYEQSANSGEKENIRNALLSIFQTKKTIKKIVKISRNIIIQNNSNSEILNFDEWERLVNKYSRYTLRAIDLISGEDSPAVKFFSQELNDQKNFDPKLILDDLNLIQNIFKQYEKANSTKEYFEQWYKDAVSYVTDGFDLSEKDQLLKSYSVIIFSGITNVSFNQYKKRLELLSLVDEQAQAAGFQEDISIGQLFNASRFSLFYIGGNGVKYDLSDVDTNVFDNHLFLLKEIASKMQNQAYLMEILKDDYNLFMRKVLAYLSIKGDTELDKANPHINGKTLKWHMKKYQMDEKTNEEIVDNIYEADKKNRLKALFYVSNLIVGSLSKEKAVPYLTLMRNAIIANEFDGSWESNMSEEDPELRFAAFDSFYTDAKFHLPNSLDLSLDKMSKLKAEFARFSHEVFSEMKKVKVQKTKDTAGYWFVPAGFLGIFRGRTNIIDCSFDMPGYGNAFTRAMHRDTEYFFIYKDNPQLNRRITLANASGTRLSPIDFNQGNNLRGYLGVQHAQNVVEVVEDDQETDQTTSDLLAIDVIQSPSIKTQSLLTATLHQLDLMATGAGFKGTALPRKSEMESSFNFDNDQTLQKMKIYKKGKKIKLQTAHNDSWQAFKNFRDKDGDRLRKDVFNTIEDEGFRFLNPQHLTETVDNAMVAQKQVNPDSLGGINFNQESFNIIETGEAIDFNIDNAMLNEISPESVTGIIPVIINVTPLKSILPLLGKGQRKQSESPDLSFN